MSAPERIERDGAALSLWRDGPSLNGARTAALGAFSCESADAGAKLLKDVCAQLKNEGFGAALGPMDGDTWASYRLVIESDGRAPFLLELTNPAHYPIAFDAAGFSIVSRYCSAERIAEAPPPARERDGSLVLRNFDRSRAREELTRLHALSLTAFANNPFYQPIAAERFFASYEPVLDLLDPDFVLLAEDRAGELKGFLFAIPNLAEGPEPQAVILKTYASLAKGAGSLLADVLHTRALEKGYTRVIHALMHDDNVSARHSERTGGEVFRRYALWGRTL